MSDALIVATILFLAVQVYHYAGYPILLAAIRAIAPRPVHKEPISPKVSFIISAYNEARIIAEKLENTLAIDYGPLEIIVVSDGSDDGTERLVARYADRGVISLFDPVRRGKSAAMNRAAAAASGEILVFSDANAFCEPEAVRRIVANYADPVVGCVSGRKHVRSFDERGQLSPLGTSDGLYWRYESTIRLWESECDSTVSVVGELLSVPRALFAPIPATYINDDSYLALRVLRLGYRVVYEPAAVTWEFPSGGMHDEVLRRRRIAAGRCQLLLRRENWPWSRPFVVFSLFSHKFLRLFLPIFMAGALIANLALVLYPPVPPAMLVLLAGQAGFYGLAALGLAAERTGRKWRLAYLPYYLTQSNLSSLRGLCALALGRQSVIWRKAPRQAIPGTAGKSDAA